VKILFIGSGDVIERMVLKVLEIGYDVIGLVKEPGSNYDFKKIDVKFFKIQQISSLKCDLGIINEYRFLINIDDISFPILNYHSGILPNNRGFSSNLMAYLNNDEIGFSVNLINNYMDEGEIFYLKKIKYEDEDYKLISKKIYNLMIKSVENVIRNFKINQYTMTNNSSNKNIYNTKLKPIDGVINNYSFNPQFYINFFKMFKNGSGFYISFKGKMIRVIDLSFTELEVDQTYFIIGSVVNFNNEFHWIRIPKGYLKLKLEKKIKIGTRLDGFQWFENKE
tara:strand:+ start:1213 stop:2052 length:840 start_codon:yes stop_codon:yes gene_type:complete